MILYLLMRIVHEIYCQTQNLYKSILNNSNENQFLINNRSTKNMNTEILSLNNSVAQNSCFKKVKSILIFF